MIPLSPEFRAGLSDRAVAKVALAEVTHPAGVDRVWTGLGRLPWNGADWIGLGDLTGVSDIAEDDQVAVSDLVFTLAGVDPERLKLLDSNVKGQTARLWFSLVRPGLVVIPSPLRLRVARLDVVQHKVDESRTATIIVTAHPDLWKSDQPNRAAFTREEQQRRFPEDTGFDLTGTSSTGAWRR